MTQLDASVDKDVAMVSKVDRLPAGTAHFLIGNFCHQSGTVYAVSFYNPNAWTGVCTHNLYNLTPSSGIPLERDLHTLYINPTELMQLQDMLPQVIHFGHMFTWTRNNKSCNKKWKRRWKTTNKRWIHGTQAEASNCTEFEDMPEYGFIKRRRKDKETPDKNHFRYVQPLFSRPYQP